MKRFVIITVISALLLTALSACGAEEKPTDTNYTAENIAAAVILSQSGFPELTAVRESEEFDYYKTLYLGEFAKNAIGGVICYPFGAEASEVAVFEMDSPESARGAAEPLGEYPASRAGAFQGYAPEEAELARSGITLIRGVFAAVVICRDTKAAEAAFDACFGEDAPEPPELAPLLTENGEWAEDPPDPPEVTEDEYDHDAVLTAWRTGETRSLTPKNLAIYEACSDVIDELISDGMTDYEKELAIHDYLVFHADYDEAELSHGAAGLTPDPDNDNPYGFLINGKGICLGYTLTFQLFMDMLDVECITVRGYAYMRTEDHAWNMVRLDGEWYCVDVTWDDPVFSWDVPETMKLYYARAYFNVTSDYLRDSDHQWDEDVPEATATKYAWKY